MGKVWMILMILISGFVQSQESTIETSRNLRDQLKHKVTIAPNPCRGYTVVNVPEGATCMLLTSQGQIIGNWAVHDGKLSLENLSEGFYWLIVKYDNQIARKKILVL